MSSRDEIDAIEEIEEMDEMEELEGMDALERQRIQRRREHMAAMRRQKRRQELLRSWALLIMAGLVVLVLCVWGVVRLAAGHSREGGETPDSETLESFQAERDSVENGGQYAAGKEPPQFSLTPEEPGPEETVPETPGPGDTLAAPEEPVPGEMTGEEPTAGGTGEEDSSQGEPEPFTFNPRATERTLSFPEEGRGVYSTNGVLIDVEAEEIVASRDPFQRINPASMTKVLTLLVAAEHVSDLQDTFTMTIEITDYSYQHGCSIAGYGVGKSVTIEELMYGTILPSGADAALALAEYVAGSQEAFVELMNQKLEELGLSDTAHFTNCVGLYDEEHYCTVYDMAIILKAASDNELCRRVLSARTFATSVPSEDQPEGILLSNWFLRRIEDKDTHGEVLCAKTGFVNQSGSCAASLAVDHAGREYICVTTGSISNWACIYDHVELYQAFLE